MKIFKSSIIFAVLLPVLFALTSWCPAYGQTVSSFSCNSPTATANWPRNVFKSTCNIVINRAGRTGVQVGIDVTNYTTTRVSGNGANITFTNPENPTYRFRVDAPFQPGVLRNITTNNAAGTITMLKNNINTDADANFSFDLYYTTYEADYGGTVYNQPYEIRVFRSNGTRTQTYTTGTTFSFTIENKQYITVSAEPSIELTTSSQVFNTGQYYDSNTFTVNVKANNTWALQSKLAGNLTSGSNNIPYTSAYFLCTDTASYVCSATSRTQFTNIDNYQQIGTNNAGTNRTGTSNNINLTGVDVPVTYSLLNSSVFKPGFYNTTTTFNVHSPNP